ncbi:MAG: NAD(P)/FAD-dependent oxidoreductase, partial [Oscillospiraceae bacterium]|nr:NAD(P)/FAD-dependent oxidoreductase [Oscillospiraceae bacterium]
VTGATVTPEILREASPDALIVAIGAIPSTPPIPGIGSANVVLVNDVDTGEAQTGKRVVILGAGFSGSECAIPLLREGKEVTLIDLIPCVAYDMNNMGSQVWLSIQRMHRELGAKFVFDAKIAKITPDGVKYTDKDGAEGFIPCDTVVNALGLKVDNNAVNDLLLSAPESYAIGDCLGSDMTIDNAVLTGFTYAMEL